MKKVLMIAYAYPPVAGSGVQRTLKFVKYLPEFGWKPCVLTVNSAYDYYEDPSLIHDVREDLVAVYRTASLEPMKWVRKVLKYLSDNRVEKRGEIVMKRRPVKKPSWLLKIKEHIFIPDGEIGWLPFAVLKGWQIIRKEEIDVIYSTSCPYTSHLIACLLKKLTDKPWLADFRDPWSMNLKAPQFAFRKFMDQHLERWVLHNTNRTIAVTQVIEDELRSVYPAGSYATIPNGYDEADFVNIDTDKFKSDKFTITHTGILYKERSPKNFLIALTEIFAEKPELRQKWRVRFVGQLDNPGEVDNYQFLTLLKLGETVQLFDYVPHRTSIEYALSSDILLLIIDNAFGSNGIMTGKIFEYLRSGIPILGLVPTEGIAAKTVQDTNAGIVIDFQSVPAIKEALLHLYDLFQKGELKNTFQRNQIRKYSRENLTADMSREFDNLHQT